MTREAMFFRPSRLLAALAVAGSAGALASACREAPVREELPPQGVLRGTLLYSGPPPCTKDQHVLGEGIILLFDERLLPPPEGLATRSARIQVLSGDDLFADASRRLTFNADGSIWCPAANTAPIFATASWTLSPVEAGGYQARAFYDRQGTFQPAFRFSNLPQKGDITGGAIDNINQVLAGQAPPKFTRILVGTPDSAGVLKMPALGVFVDNITVAIAAPQSVERPFFYVSGYQPALQPKEASEVNPSVVAPDFIEGTPAVITMPADFHLGTASATQAQPYLYVMRLTAGVPDSEVPAAIASPFFFRVQANPASQPVPISTPLLNVFWFDLNRDGVIDIAHDHVVGSDLAASLAPLVSLQKLDSTDLIRRTAQAVPRIISSAITLPTPTFTDILSFQAQPGATTPTGQAQAYAAVRPTAVCVLEPLNANGDTVIVTPFKNTVSGSPTVVNVELTKSDIATLLRRNVDNVKILYGCLPPADLTVNAINEPDIKGFSLGGQAWTVPNESGVCMPGEDAGGATTCGSRTRLVSQDTVFRFGKPNDVTFCNANGYALEGEDDAAKARATFRTNCLNVAEQDKFDRGVLWSDLK